MITPGKLFQLEAGQKRRKLALTLGKLERDVLGIAERGMEYDFPSMTRAEYIRTIVRIVADDPALPEDTAAELKAMMEQDVLDERGVCNFARNALLAVIGTPPAEWDLIIAPHSREQGTVRARSFFKGVCVYAEDIRSPFNIGSIFRTAEAMGCERIYISPNCTDPLQSRALRSAMGCVETMGFTRCALGELPAGVPVFVLETGGTPIQDFVFPEQGIVIVGSEELGASPEAIRRAEYGHVSIPMRGLKASLNVGVAFGILMQAWTEQLARRAEDAGAPAPVPPRT